MSKDNDEGILGLRRFIFLPKLMKVKDGFVKLAGRTYEKMGIIIETESGRDYLAKLPVDWYTVIFSRNEIVGCRDSEGTYFEEKIFNACDEVVGRIRYYQHVSGIINRTLFLEGAEDEKPKSKGNVPGQHRVYKRREEDE